MDGAGASSGVVGVRNPKKSGKKNKHKHNGGNAAEKRCNLKVPKEEENSEAPTEIEEIKNTDGFPFVIKHSDIMGRYIVASRDLKPGELIMTADPLAVGPPQGCQPMCLGCYKKVDLEDKPFRCEGCGWPMCGNKCPGKGFVYGHTKAECSLYESVRSKLLSADNDYLTSLYMIVVPVRCLLLEKQDPEKYKVLMTMEPHNNIRRKIPTTWNSNQLNVVDRIRKDLGMTQFDEELIHTMCGILEVNAFEVGQNEISIRGCYPRAFYMAHDCVPNTGHSDHNFTLHVRATTLITKGSQINLSYAYTLQDTLKRREHLKESKFFDCICARCSDPTELGTYAGALKCPKCGTGTVLSTEPLNSKAPWRCKNQFCVGYTVPGHSIKQLMEKIGDELEQLDENDITALEAFLTRYHNVLHPNHYHFLGVMHSLSQLYGKAPGYVINTMTEKELCRKRDICKHLLKVVDILEPGYSRLRGVLLYELHAPLMILITRAVEAKTLAYRDLRSKLKEVADCLEESSLILSFEPANSHEGITGGAAKEALTRVKEWQKVISNS